MIAPPGSNRQFLELVVIVKRVKMARYSPKEHMQRRIEFHKTLQARRESFPSKERKDKILQHPEYMKLEFDPVAVRMIPDTYREKRPYSIYGKGAIDKICERIIAGETIVSITQDPQMPSQAQIYNAMASDPAFAAKINQARQAAAHAIADQTLAIVDNATSEDVQVRNLQMKARQWYSSKVAPKQYGQTREADEDSNTLHIVIEGGLPPAEAPVSLDIEFQRVSPGTQGDTE